MAAKKPSSLDKVLDRLDRLDDAGLRTLVQRLARERALLDTVFNTLQEGVLVITEGGQIDYANGAAARLIGFQDEAGAEKTLWRLVPGLRASLEGATPEGKPAGGPVVTREFELTYPAPRVVRLYMVPFSEGEGGAPRSAIILTDITTEKRSTEELIENEKISSILLLAEREDIVHPPARRRRRPRTGQPAQLAHHPPPAHRAEAEETEGLEGGRRPRRLHPDLPGRGHPARRHHSQLP